MPKGKSKELEQERVKKEPGEIISFREFGERVKVWDEYYTKVKGTRAHMRFQEQRKALLEGDFGLMKELAAQAKESREKGGWKLEKPSFPDPRIEQVYGRLDIGENTYEQAKMIFEGGKTS